MIWSSSSPKAAGDLIMLARAGRRLLESLAGSLVPKASSRRAQLAAAIAGRWKLRWPRTKAQRQGAAAPTTMPTPPGAAASGLRQRTKPFLDMLRRCDAAGLTSSGACNPFVVAQSTLAPEALTTGCRADSASIIRRTRRGVAAGDGAIARQQLLLHCGACWSLGGLLLDAVDDVHRGARFASSQTTSWPQSPLSGDATVPLYRSHRQRGRALRRWSPPGRSGLPARISCIDEGRLSNITSMSPPPGPAGRARAGGTHHAS